MLAEDASPEDKEPAIECFVCGFVYDRVYQEIDAKTGERLPPNLTVRSAMPFEAREKARSEMREDFVRTVLRDGVRRENFTGVARRGKRVTHG